MFAEDITAYFADFAVPAKVGNPPASVMGIFDDLGSDSFGLVQSTTPTLLLESATLPESVRVGDPVEVSEVAYRIAAIHPDGTGLTHLVLKES